MRRRYRYVKDPDTGAVREIEVGTQAPPRTGGFVLPDIAEFRSPLDGSVISSRSQLREHEKAHGVRQCGELKRASDFDWKPRMPSNLNSYWSDYP
jgi:hypothetical protein